MRTAQVRSRLMLLAAASVSLVVPVGLLLVRLLETGRSPREELARMAVSYCYVWGSTTLLAVGSTWWLGRRLTLARRVSETDPLTGLFNRRHFATSLLSEMEHDRTRGLPTCVLCVDLDRLKTLNDVYGHGHGDAALVVVAGALSHGLRNRDVVARFGGDEFAVLLPDTLAHTAVGIGERILTDLTRLSSTFAGGLSVSIGVAELERTESGADVLEAADRALYWAKNSGGGRVALAPRSEP